jgi:Na+(H+)/acetate symporter ActP
MIITNHLDVIVIISTFMLKSKREQHSTWGILIVLFSVLSMFVGPMGGMGIGLILGLIGGILAITWKPDQPKTQS